MLASIRARTRPLMMKQFLFASDMHLCKQDPTRNIRVCQTLEQLSEQTQAVYILGDLFDAWLGDDCDEPWIVPIQESLRQIANTQPLYIMRGNHDSLLGKTFCDQVGATYLPDPHLIMLSGKRTLLTHGDALCTDDLAFQRLRKVLYHPLVKRLFTSLPMTWRHRLATALENASHQSQQQVNQGAVDTTINALLNAYQAEQIIYGHVHRKAMIPHPQGRRFVLGAWDQANPTWLLPVDDVVHSVA